MQFGRSTGQRRCCFGNAMRATAVAAAACIALPAAQAQRWNGGVTVASDKVQRGITQNDGSTVWMADLGITSDTGWNASAGWARPVYQSLGGSGEISLGGSKLWQLDADWVLLAGAARYFYLGQARARHASYTELSASLGWQGRLFGTAVFTPDASGYAGGVRLEARTLALELAARQRLSGRWALEAGAGYNAADGPLDRSYPYGSAGLRWGAGPFQAQASWITSGAADAGVPRRRAGQRWVASLGWAF